MLTMVAFGIGELIGGPVIGQIVDKVNSKVACIVNVLLIVAMITVTYVYLIVYEYCWLAYVMTFLWGMQDSAVNTHVFEMLGFEFDNN